MTCTTLPARQSIADQVRLMLAELLNASLCEVVDGALLVHDLHADDLDMLEITFRLSEIADNEPTDSQVEGLKTVSDCIRLAELLADEMAGAA